MKNIKWTRKWKWLPMSILFLSPYATWQVAARMNLFGTHLEERLRISAVDATNTIEQIENQIFDLVNAHRKKINKPLLVRNSAMDEQARIHSRNMAAGKVAFGHIGATKRLKIIAKSLKSMDRGGENVFECSGSFPNLAAEALKGWLESEGHRENIEGDYNLTGMGVAIAPNGDYYFTQIFARGISK
jgi:uncharacterized protein YkwD